MRRLLVLLGLALVVFVAVERQRIFLRDPIATVTRDGVKQSDVSVMINYGNDVLLDAGPLSQGERRLSLLQHWNGIAGVPLLPLKCVSGLACMTDADHAMIRALSVGSRSGRETSAEVTMTNRRVSFVDEDGAQVVVQLR